MDFTNILNTVGGLLCMALSTYGAIILALVFFKRHTMAKKYSLFNDDGIVTCIGLVGAMGVIGDLIGLSPNGMESLSPSGFLLSLVLFIGGPILFLWTLVKGIGKIRSYIPDEDREPEED